ELRAVIADRPNDAEARHNLGTALFKLNDLDAAIGELGQAARLDPRLSEARINLAQALRKAGRMEEARIEMVESQKALTQKPNAGRALVLSEAAAQHVKTGDLKTAIAELREAVSLNPELPDAHFLLASTLRQSSADPIEIIRALRRVLEL